MSRPVKTIICSLIVRKCKVNPPVSLVEIKKSNSLKF